jgi:hypothetical protein
MAASNEERFDRRCRLGYWCLVLSGCGFFVLFPRWRGQEYRFEGRWIEHGTFGLVGVTKPTFQAPIWAPPKAYSGGGAPVRWPWNPHTGRVIEIDFAGEVIFLSAVVAGCGLVLRLIYLIAWRKPTRFVRLAWSTACGLLLTGVAVFLAALLLRIGVPHPIEDHWLTLGLAAGGPIGWWFGKWRSATPIS